MKRRPIEVIVSAFASGQSDNYNYSLEELEFVEVGDVTEHGLEGGEPPSRFVLEWNVLKWSPSSITSPAVKYVREQILNRF